MHNKIYNKFWQVGDFNEEESKPALAQFLHICNAVNLISENTCYKSE